MKCSKETAQQPFGCNFLLGTHQPAHLGATHRNTEDIGLCGNIKLYYF
jgi:hypothetical protein